MENSLDDIINACFNLEGYITSHEIIWISALLISAYGVALLFRRQFKAPGGSGFRNISLRLLSSEAAYRVFAFKDLVRGMVVIAGAGSGKTKSIIEPLIKQSTQGDYTGLIYDFKFPVLSNVVYRETLLKGNNTVSYHYINFTDLTRSHRCNVIKRIDNAAFAQEYAGSLMMNLLPESIKSPDFFLRTATALLSASILYFSRCQKDMCTLPHVMSFLLNPNVQKIVEIISQEPEAADIVASVRSGLPSDKQTAGVVSTLQNSLALCSNPNVFWVLSGDDFDLDLNNQKDPKLLTIGNSATLTNSISPLVALIITVASKLMNQPGKEKSILLLDEGPTLFIPNFDTIPATGRENKIATVYCGQDVSQMVERYGEMKAEVLMANLANQFFGKISNPKTADSVVRLFGKKEVEFESRSSSNSRTTNSTGSSRSFQQRDRVSITHLRELNPGEFVASTVSKNDFKVRFNANESESFPLSELTYVTSKMVERNYLKIKSDVLKLFE